MAFTSPTRAFNSKTETGRVITYIMVTLVAVSLLVKEFVEVQESSRTLSYVSYYVVKDY